MTLDVMRDGGGGDGHHTLPPPPTVTVIPPTCNFAQNRKYVISCYKLIVVNEELWRA